MQVGHYLNAKAWDFYPFAINIISYNICFWPKTELLLSIFRKQPAGLKLFEQTLILPVNGHIEYTGLPFHVAKLTHFRKTACCKWGAGLHHWPHAEWEEKMSKIRQKKPDFIPIDASYQAQGFGGRLITSFKMVVYGVNKKKCGFCSGGIRFAL